MAKVSMYMKRQMQDHLLQFLPKGVDYKNSCSPPLCVLLCLFFLISVVNTCGVVEMYPGFYIWKITFCLLNVTFGRENHCPC